MSKITPGVQDAAYRFGAAMALAGFDLETDDDELIDEIEEAIAAGVKATQLGLSQNAEKASA